MVYLDITHLPKGRPRTSSPRSSRSTRSSPATTRGSPDEDLPRGPLLDGRALHRVRDSTCSPSRKFLTDVAAERDAAAQASRIPKDAPPRHGPRRARWNMMTNIPGLYAFGEVNYQYHGATRLGRQRPAVVHLRRRLLRAGRGQLRQEPARQDPSANCPTSVFDKFVEQENRQDPEAHPSPTGKSSQPLRSSTSRARRDHDRRDAPSCGHRKACSQGPRRGRRDLIKTKYDDAEAQRHRPRGPTRTSASPAPWATCSIYAKRC